MFFRYASEPTHRETVNEVIASKEVLQMAGERLMSISQDERERAVFRSRRMYQTDLQSDLATAEDRGRAAGIAEGRVAGIAERNFEIARNALQMGMSIDDIAKLTGLAHEEIKGLKN